MLQIKNITKIYETTGFKQKALNNISVSFREKEFVSILGPSGSGKTTLLNIIGGLDNYTSGDLIINGVSTKDYKDKDWDSYRNHRIGFVFQNYNLIMHQTVLQNVELALTLAGTSKKVRHAKAIEVLESVGLIDHINKKPNELSGGQMQRVAIARALINDPDILLADEPTGALDTETSKQIMDLLKDIAKDKLVIMVTHNPDLANIYSTRIVKVLDGKVIDDSNPYNEEDEQNNYKTKKTSMSFKTALGLSLNNLLTKKGRTILTAFAGSIGIIGIALIMSLSNGIQEYINRTEKETLANYPLQIQKQSLDMSTLISTIISKNEKRTYKDNKIHSVNVMGDVLSTMTREVKTNDLQKFKEYIESNKTNIKDYTTDIKYGYDVTLNLYKPGNDVVRVNPTTVFDAVGMGTSNVSSAYSGYMSNYDVFSELIDNEELLKQKYKLVSGKWPTKYNEIVVMVNENNEMADYTLYSLGILDQKELEDKFNRMVNGEKIDFEETSYTYDDIIGLTYKLVLPTDLYKKEGNIWVDYSNNEDYLKSVINNSEDIKIVGIIKPGEESVAGSTSGNGTVGYLHSLTEHMINKINETTIAKEQLSNPDINIFTGMEFSKNEIDYTKLTPSEIAYFSSLSPNELASLMNSLKATYKDNLKTLGIADLDNPDSISIYPKDFDSKEEIANIIQKYNKGLNDEEQITYTDIVGIMMKSVSSIVNVISSVLIAFVSISLVVSSIMIAIITYISVIERTKEIGILRAIGASKKDISRVFNAETLIEGFASGIFGIMVTLLLNLPINLIIKAKLNISNISILPINGAIILILISIVLTVIAGLIPARMASKKDPVIALRTE